MKRIALTLGMIFALFLGFAVSPNANTAQASSHFILVKNTSYSSGHIMTCGRSSIAVEPCRLIAPGKTLVESSSFEPTVLAVGAGYGILYRYVLRKDDVSAPVYGNWEGLNASAFGQGEWLDIDHELGPGVALYEIQVILSERSIIA